jgi:hypothetical protein
MLNWCECDLWVYGPREELRRFREGVRGEEELDANRNPRKLEGGGGNGN